MAKRSYETLIAEIPVYASREAGMCAVVDVIWDAFHDCGVSWVGFYAHDDTDELILGPLRDSPACSPIGLHGVCGQSFLTKKPMVVDDVRTLGDDYIACNPRDLSEIVIPLFEADGACWGVLDVDSHNVGEFEDNDVVGLTAICKRAGLTT